MISCVSHAFNISLQEFIDILTGSIYYNAKNNGCDVNHRHATRQSMESLAARSKPARVMEPKVLDPAPRIPSGCMQEGTVCFLFWVGWKLDATKNDGKNDR